jgi:heavy metal sensor kinase
MSLSIRWRLTLWNILAVAAVVLGFGALVYGLLRAALYERLDRSLRTGWQELERDTRLATDRDKRLHYLIGELEEHNNTFSIVYNQAGEAFARTDKLAADSVPPAPAVAPDGPRSFDIDLPIIGRQRALCGSLSLGGQECTVLLLSPLEDVDRSLAQLLAALATAGPVALVLGGGLAYLLARKALAPVQQLHQATAAITADRLDRRLPVANPDDELGRLTQTINAMIARLELSFTEIRRFTADASHELRTPLAVIRAEAEVALHKPLDLAEHQDLLGSILEECGRLTRLTDQLLTLARADAGRPGSCSATVDLTSLVLGAVETIRPLAEIKGVSLQTAGDGTVQVQGDEARLRQVFANLLDNAIKYTPEGGTVRVELGQRGRTALVSVRDTGVGIPPEHLHRVFDRFYRVDKARTRVQGGTGLGLSIAQKVVTDHGGRIELASTPGQGTTCTVILPTDEAKPLVGNGNGPSVQAKGE